MRTIRIGLVLFAAAVLPSCERMWDVSGGWSYRSGKFHTFVLELQQSGDRITGTACESDAVPLITGAPVSGEFPHVRAVIGPEHVAQYGEGRITARLEGEVVSRTAIGARLIYANGHETPLAFKRDPDARCPPR